MTTDFPAEWQIDAPVNAQARALRHALHRAPELSNHEVATAQTIAEAMAPLNPTRLLTGLGGTGVAAEFGAGDRALMIRCELDALPILETGTPAYRSEMPGVAHACGHDGHMAILYAVALCLSRRPPDARVILLFQPAEESGDGARDVIADPRFADLRASMAVSLHNLPKLPLGSVSLRSGPVNCASRGVKIVLTGRTSHSSQPQNGRSPGGALIALIPALEALTNNVATDAPGFRLTTVTHAVLGEEAFGISPGRAEVWVTLRTLLDDDMATLEAEARALVADLAGDFAPEISIHEPFGHCINDDTATALLDRACAPLRRVSDGLPMRASEDFGLFGHHMPSAMLFLGSGETHPELHNPDYDFPDALIPVGAGIFLRAIKEFAGNA